VAAALALAIKHNNKHNTTQASMLFAMMCDFFKKFWFILPQCDRCRATTRRFEHQRQVVVRRRRGVIEWSGECCWAWRQDCRCLPLVSVLPSCALACVALACLLLCRWSAVHRHHTVFKQIYQSINEKQL